METCSLCLVYSSLYYSVNYLHWCWNVQQQVMPYPHNRALYHCDNQVMASSAPCVQVQLASLLLVNRVMPYEICFFHLFLFSTFTSGVCVQHNISPCFSTGGLCRIQTSMHTHIHTANQIKHRDPGHIFPN